MSTLKSLFEEFIAGVPIDLDPDIISCLRLAFYTGAAAAAHCIGESDESFNQVVAELDEYHHPRCSCIEFSQDVTFPHQKRVIH